MGATAGVTLTPTGYVRHLEQKGLWVFKKETPKPGPGALVTFSKYYLWVIFPLSAQHSPRESHVTTSASPASSLGKTDPLNQPVFQVWAASMAKKRGNSELYKEPYLFSFTASNTINKTKHCLLCAKYRVPCGTVNDYQRSQTCISMKWGRLATEEAERGGGHSLVAIL